MGWEILSPCRIEAQWNGQGKIDDLEVSISDESWGARRIAASHFGSGILTFRFGYVFRTDPGCGLLVKGTPNLAKDGVSPLEGFVETDWLPYTFTMNWQFTRPCKVTFEKDEPLCFIVPIRYTDLTDFRPEIVPIAEDPLLEAAFKTWSDERKDFLDKLSEGDPETVRKAWQKWYTSGKTPDGTKRNPKHLTKLALATPLEKDNDSRNAESCVLGPEE